MVAGWNSAWLPMGVQEEVLGSAWRSLRTVLWPRRQALVLLNFGAVCAGNVKGKRRWLGQYAKLRVVSDDRMK